jgi:hypothetical protein
MAEFAMDYGARPENYGPLIAAMIQGGSQNQPAAEKPRSAAAKRPYLAVDDPQGLVETGNLQITNRPIVKNADGTGEETKLFENAGMGTVVPLSWTPDGGSLVFTIPGIKTAADLWVVSLSSDHKAEPLLQSTFAENHGQVSPDGRWLAYSSTETGVPEIYIKAAFGDGGKWNVSNGVGNAPRWRGDGRELYYVNGNGKIMAVEISTKGAAVVPGTPTPLFDYSGLANLGHATLYSYAVSADGQRFLISGAKDSGATLVQQPIAFAQHDLDDARVAEELAQEVFLKLPLVAVVPVGALFRRRAPPAWIG